MSRLAKAGILGLVLLAVGGVATVAAGVFEIGPDQEKKVKVKTRKAPEVSVKVGKDKSSLEDPGDVSDVPYGLALGKVRLVIEDGKKKKNAETGALHGDGTFECGMEEVSSKHGPLQRIDLFVEKDITYCMGWYKDMPTDFEDTVKCVRCPESSRLVCGSKPACID